MTDDRKLLFIALLGWCLVFVLTIERREPFSIMAGFIALGLAIDYLRPLKRSP